MFKVIIIDRDNTSNEIISIKNNSTQPPFCGEHMSERGQNHIVTCVGFWRGWLVDHRGFGLKQDFPVVQSAK